MACGVGHHRGGIAGLVRLLREHGEAIEYDLIALGLRRDWLGTPALSWRDLLVITRQTPQGTALHRAVNGERSDWTLPVALLADIYDVLNAANWQRSGGKGRRPKPWPRPKDPSATPAGKRWGAGPKTQDELDRLLGWPTTPAGGRRV